MFSYPSFGIKNLLWEIHYYTYSFTDLFGVFWVAIVAVVAVDVYNMVNI